jgi:hypothetical protein
VAERRLTLEERLVDLRAHLVLPEGPDVTARVRREIEARPRTLRERLLPAASFRRALVVAALVLALIAGGLVTFSPAARNAVADWLGLTGLRIRVGGPQPTPAASPHLNLGFRVSLADARADAPFEIRVPDELGPPDAVHLLSGASSQVSLVYRPRPGLPESGETNVGLLLTQFQGTLEEELMTKVVSEGATVDPVSIAGDMGYWIASGPHFFFYVDPNGHVIEDTVRLADNVVVWERGGVTLRLETALPRGEALALARSIP